MGVLEQGESTKQPWIKCFSNEDQDFWNNERNNQRRENLGEGSPLDFMYGDLKYPNLEQSQTNFEMLLPSV
jgi:hypothetical protein